MDAHEQLVAARNYIDRYGWFQGAFSDGWGWAVPRCIWGACTIVADDVKGLAYKEVREALVAEAQKSVDHRWCIGWGGLADWNDVEGRTKAEVLDLFDRAIAATAPPPDVASLNLNENGGRKDWNALEVLAR